MTDSGKDQANHDEFVAKNFEDLALARSFFRHFLPAEILEQVDLEKLALEQGSYVDEDLRRSYSDLNYTVPLRNPALESPCRAYIYILVEHKSESDEFTVFQLLRYMVRIWQRELEDAGYRKGFRLPPIVPLVLHHGRSEFKAPVELGDLVVKMDGMGRFVPDYRCLLIDLMQVSPEEMPKSDPRLHAVLAVMRSIFDEETIEPFRDALFRLAAIMDRPETRRTLATILGYIFRNASKMTDKDLRSIVEPLGKVGEDAMSTLIEKWKDEGREEGIEKGREEGREEGRQEGRIEDRQDSIIDILSTRFEVVPDSVRKAICEIHDAERLAKLTATAVKCPSVEQFAESLG